MLTRAEQEAGIERIRQWPAEERAFVAKLRGTELECVIAIAGMLDAEPVDEPERVRRGSHRVRP